MLRRLDIIDRIEFVQATTGYLRSIPIGRMNKGNQLTLFDPRTERLQRIEADPMVDPVIRM